MVSVFWGVVSVSLFVVVVAASSGSMITCVFCVLRVAFKWKKSRTRITVARTRTHRPYRAGKASIMRGEWWRGRKEEELGGRDRNRGSFVLHNPRRSGDQCK